MDKRQADTTVLLGERVVGQTIWEVVTLTINDLHMCGIIVGLRRGRH